MENIVESQIDDIHMIVYIILKLFIVLLSFYLVCFPRKSNFMRTILKLFKMSKKPWYTPKTLSLVNKYKNDTVA